jgi:hypothetical protein
VAERPLVQIEGLDELRRDLGRIDRDMMGKVMVDAGLAISTPAARAIAAAVPHRSGRLAGSVRPSKIRTGAAVRTGKRAVPYAGPVEFGGYPGRRPYVPTGRYIFPTAASFTSGAAERYATEINRGLNQFNWTFTGRVR